MRRRAPRPLPLCGLLLIALLAFARAGQAEPATTAAVMPLGKGAGAAEFEGMGRALADMIVTDLSESEELVLVERIKLGLVLDELKLGRSGYLDPKSAQKLGKGLGAQLVITGSFSIVGETFVIDVRAIRVESGTIVKAARAEGKLDDFVAIEKQVVEGLLDGLSLKLSAGARRKLMMQAPTENAKALAHYGKALEAKELGKPKVAEKNFEEALESDPRFTEAYDELQKLKRDVETALSDERDRRQAERAKSIKDFLRATPSELSRKRNFKDTQRSMIDFALRIYALKIEGQWCQSYQELSHYLFRRKGNFGPWFESLAPVYQDAYALGRDLIAARIQRDKLQWIGDAGSVMMYSALEMSSGMSMAVDRSLSPETGRSGVLASLQRCYPPNDRLREFLKIAPKLRKMSWLKAPMWTTYGEGPTTLTSEDALDLYEALLRAEASGIDKRVRALTDGALKRHPPGDPEHHAVLRRIETIVNSAKR